MSRSNIIMETREWEDYATLTPDERLSLWAMRYYQGGHHRLAQEQPQVHLKEGKKNGNMGEHCHSNPGCNLPSVPSRQAEKMNLIPLHR